MFETKVIDFQPAIQEEHLITSSLKSVDTILFEEDSAADCLRRVLWLSNNHLTILITNLSSFRNWILLPLILHCRSLWSMCMDMEVGNWSRSKPGRASGVCSEKRRDLDTSKRSAVHFIEPKSTSTSPCRWGHSGRCRAEIESGCLRQVCRESGIGYLAWVAPEHYLQSSTRKAKSMP